MSARKAKPEDPGHKVVARNRRARHHFHVMETLDAGIVLVGTEVKSIRAGKISLTDAFVQVHNQEAWMMSLHIAEYADGTWANHETKRRRKILLHKQQLRKLSRQLEKKGLTAVPLEVYFNEKGLAKVIVGICVGKQAHDKRADIKKRDLEREIRTYK